VQTTSKNPIAGFRPDAIGLLRFADRARWNKPADPSSNVERNWRRQASDRAVSGEDCTVWKWTRAPPASARSLNWSNVDGSRSMLVP